MRLLYGKILIWRVSGRIWISDNVFDFGEKEPGDYYRVYLEHVSGQPFARILNVNAETLQIRIWNAESKKFVGDDIIDINYALTEYNIVVFRKYHEITVRYDSEVEFLIKDWWYPRLFRFKESLFQGTYQLATPIRTERLDVLSAILDKRFNDDSFDYIIGEDSVSINEIMTKIFGERILRHRDFAKIHSRISLITESLVESGDIESVGDMQFRPKGKAISTLSQSITDDRRHRDIVWLTRGLIFVGLLGIDWSKLYKLSQKFLKNIFESLNNISFIFFSLTKLHFNRPFCFECDLWFM